MVRHQIGPGSVFHELELRGDENPVDSFLRSAGAESVTIGGIRFKRPKPESLGQQTHGIVVVFPATVEIAHEHDRRVNLGQCFDHDLHFSAARSGRPRRQMHRHHLQRSARQFDPGGDEPFGVQMAEVKPHRRRRFQFLLREQGRAIRHTKRTDAQVEVDAVVHVRQRRPLGNTLYMMKRAAPRRGGVRLLQGDDIRIVAGNGIGARVDIPPKSVRW